MTLLLIEFGVGIAVGLLLQMLITSLSIINRLDRIIELLEGKR